MAINGTRTEARGDRPQRRIVVGVDGSRESRQVIREAARTAQLLDADLEALCVFRDDFERRWTWPALVTDTEIDAHVDRLVRDAVVGCWDHRTGRALTVATAQGNPAEELIARSANASLLVIGHGEGSPVGDALLGSVALQCVEHAKVAVLLIRTDEVEDAHGAEHGPSAGRVVVGIDGSTVSKEALRVGAAFAAATGTGLDAIRSWAPPVYVGQFGTAYIAPEVIDWRRRAESELAMDVEEALGETPPVDVRQIVEPGYPAHHLIDHSRGAALLVVGSRGRGGFASLVLGSVSVKCVHHSRCPVVVVHGTATLTTGAHTAAAAAEPRTGEPVTEPALQSV